MTASDPPKKTLYVLDTNVLLHDPTSLFNFQEHDIGIPLVVLEELDRHKKGVADTARHARQVARSLGSILEKISSEVNLDDGLALSSITGHGATGKLYFLKEVTKVAASGFDDTKVDNLILNCVHSARLTGSHAVLVTKDINLRIKAHSLKIPAEDYRNDRAFNDEDVLPTGFITVRDNFWTENACEKQFFRRKDANYARIPKELPVNSFLLDNSKRENGRVLRVDSVENGFSLLRILGSCSNKLITPRSREQAMALDLLHDTDVDFVALLGMAGSGKTLLALAAGLSQSADGIYDKTIITRATVPLGGEDIGFLPGNEEEKMSAWLGGTVQDSLSSIGAKAAEITKTKLEIASMTFMRGRSFQNQFIIIDEAQNLTSKQIHALITRAGKGTKIVVTGNLGQIDSPYLDAGSSGLSWAVKNLQGWQHAGNLILPRGERSRLASFVEEISQSRDGASHES